eukprot:22717_1
MAQTEGATAPLIQPYNTAQPQQVYSQQGYVAPQPAPAVVYPVVAQGQPVMAQVQPQPAIVVVTQQQPVIGNTQIISRTSQSCFCSRCNAMVTTITTPAPGCATYATVGGCLLVGCWLGCCLIPFCVDSLQDVEHRCVKCNTILGKYRVIG